MKTYAKFLLMGGSFAAGVGAYAIYNYWKRQQLKAIDEGFEDVSRIEENLIKKVLILGQQNSGKSTILKILTNTYARPTSGISVATMEQEGVTLNMCEVAGGESYKPFWPNFFEGTDIVLFVVDSADMHSLSLAVSEVAGLLSDLRLATAQFLVVAHKQDLPNAISPEEVARALDIKKGGHRVTVLGTQAPPTRREDRHALDSIKAVLLQLAFA